MSHGRWWARQLGRALLAAMALSACVGVLGLDERANAVAELCKCDQQLPSFEGGCEQVLGERLAGASEPTRAAWLAYFADRCTGAGACQRAYECYAQPPTCSSRSCKSDAECCGQLDGSAYCDEGSGECRDCLGNGANCTRDEQCCGSKGGASCTQGACTSGA